MKEVTNEMATQWQKAPYVVLGTGELAVEKAAEMYGKAFSIGQKARRTDVGQVYDGLADRGEALVRRLRRSKTAKRAVAGTKQATRQVKGAVTSVRKAVGWEEQKKSSSRKAS
jgi:hypothetical protein